jgi:SAM-dependent methyltransferase
VDELERRLADYYDREGRARAAMPIGPHRVEQRRAFVELLLGERRQRLIDVGSGPGRDTLLFAAKGFTAMAVDRSRGHCQLAAAAGLLAVQATLLALPFPPATFDAGWSMSTLVHVPDNRWDVALASITTVLKPGAPLAIGLWGGLDDERWHPPRDGLPGRFFSLRAHDRAKAMLRRHGEVESFLTWSEGRRDWEYQFAVLRVGGRRNSTFLSRRAGSSVV